MQRSSEVAHQRSAPRSRRAATSLCRDLGAVVSTGRTNRLHRLAVRVTRGAASWSVAVERLPWAIPLHRPQLWCCACMTAGMVIKRHSSVAALSIRGNVPSNHCSATLAASTVFLTAALALSPFAALAAQAPAPAPTPQVTLTGCLRSSAVGDGKTGSQAVVYTLDVSAARGEKGGKGTTSSTPLTPALYTLVAARDVALAGHVNHRVELKGRMREGQTTTTGIPGKPSPEAAEVADPTAAAASRTFEVESLKMISATCPVPAGI